MIDSSPAMEEMVSSGLAGMDIFHGEGEGAAPPKKRGEKMKGARREKLSRGPPPSPSPSGEGLEEEPPETEVYREEDEIDNFRGLWDSRFAGEFGSFDDQTSLGPMRYTSGPIPRHARPDCTMNIFHIRVADLEDGLQWPLHVHGLVAARDSADHNRNFLFNRTRDNCQILTQEDPYLLLTGPSRAVVIIDPITVEFQLKVKSRTEPEEDELLAFRIFNYPQTYLSKHVIRSSILCKHCTIEFAYAPLVPSVEATVSIQVIDGVWPERIRGRVIACITTVSEGRVLLLDSRDGMMPISPSTGAIELSRRVVSVDLKGGKLLVSVVPSQIGEEDNNNDNDVVRGESVFEPKRAGTSHDTCDLGFCKIEVTVAWSLLSNLTDERRAASKRTDKRQ